MVEMMKAVGFYRSLPIGTPDALVDIDVQKPIPDTRDLLVKVEAISVNPADYRSRLRKADDGKLAILGWDVAGTVVQLGADVPSTFTVGDRVYYAGDNSRQGANSQFHIVDYRIVGHRPAGISATEAAALPLVTLTAWEALFDRLGLNVEGSNRFRSLLVIGGAGGVGSMVLQLARQIPDITLVATASRIESRGWCSAMGAKFTVDHYQPLATQLKAIGLSTVDAVLILSNPEMHFDSLSDIVTPQGAVCCIVPFLNTPNMNSLMRKSISFHWELMFTRPAFKTTDISRQSDILNEVSKMVDNGVIRSPLQVELSPFSAASLVEAHKLLETQRTIGKIVVSGF